MKTMEISMQEMRELLAGGGGGQMSKPESGVDLGQNIVVLDRGFVYVGNVTEYPDRFRIEKARNIRVWGTKNGLGELRDGPLPETKLDAAETVVAFKRAVMHWIPCRGF
jgi:hypothetical protein